MLVSAREAFNSKLLYSTIRRTFFNEVKFVDNLPKQGLRYKLFNAQNKVFKVLKDEIHAPQTSLGQRLSSKSSYLVFKSGQSPIITLLKQIGVLAFSSILFYFTFKKSRSYLTYTLLLGLNIGILGFLIRSPRAKFWRHIKQIELGHDMNKVFVTLGHNKVLNVELKDMYLVKQALQKNSRSAMIFDEIVVGIKGHSYAIPIQNAIVPDDELFVSVVRGYKLVNANK